MSPEGLRAARLSLGVALLLAAAPALGGCRALCYTHDEMPRSEALTTPYDTVDYIRFCARLGLWDELYASLSTRTRIELFEEEPDLERGPPFGFGYGFPRATFGQLDPRLPREIREVRVIELVHLSSILAIERGVPQPGMAQVVLDLEPVPFDMSAFLLVDEGTRRAPRWTLGLAETIDWLQGTLQPISNQRPPGGR